MTENVRRMLAGRYEIGELIGRGGMAAVHVGYDSRLSRTVAIKLLRTDLAEDSTFHARFRREAQSAAALNHPSIVAVYDTGEETITDSAGRTATLPFIVMEYVEGHTVRELLKDGSAVPIEEAVEITIGVLGALEYAHNEGIVHRDIKPGNVMLTPTGQIKVMDFGIARALADNAATMTQTNSVVGTAQYLSPEQARGEAVDQRSDLYSAGCLLYELLTGRPPFQGESAVSVAYQHVREMPVAPSHLASDVPEALDRVVMKALAKDREERYQDANDFRSDLLAILRGGRVHAPATTQWLPVSRQVAPAPLSAPATTVMPAAAMAGPGSTGLLPVARPLDDDDAPRSRWWIWLIVAVALISLGFGVYAMMSGPSGPELIAVPDVKGLSQADAAAKITGENLIFVDGGTETSEDVEPGLATRSDPETDVKVDPGSTVTVYFSAGLEEVAIPDVAGMTAEQARDRLEQEKFVFGIPQTEDAPGIREGLVVRTNPEIGQKAPRGSEVVVYLASGEVELPALTNEHKDRAVEILTELELRYTLKPVESTEFPADSVISQQPGAGRVPVDALVVLEISEGPPNQSPIITGAGPISVPQGSNFDPMYGVKASDPEDGDITSQIVIRGLNEFDINTPGVYVLTYSVTDSGDLTTEVVRVVTVTPSYEPDPSP